MNFELSYGDISILFFLTLGPLKAILPFARATRGTELAFQRTVAWRSTAIATVIALVVALFGPLVLTNWHVTSPAVSITAGLILFSQALRIVMQFLRRHFTAYLGHALHHDLSKAEGRPAGERATRDIVEWSSLAYRSPTSVSSGWRVGETFP